MNYSLLPSISHAQFPAVYQRAQASLQECARIDECKKWSDTSKAIASYAKQSQNKELEHLAMRIRARAVRRCGELLKMIEKAQNQHDVRARSDTGPSRNRAAKDAGLSKRQAKDAIRVANVNGKSFETQIESDNPPTVTKLAEQGKQVSKGIPIYEKLGMTKQAFQAGMYFRGDMDHYIKSTEKHDACNVIAGSTPEERQAIKRNIKIIAKYHERLETEL